MLYFHFITKNVSMFYSVFFIFRDMIKTNVPGVDSAKTRNTKKSLSLENTMVLIRGGNL